MAGEAAFAGDYVEDAVGDYGALVSEGATVGSYSVDCFVGLGRVEIPENRAVACRVGAEVSVFAIPRKLRRESR